MGVRTGCVSTNDRIERIFSDGSISVAMSPKREIIPEKRNRMMQRVKNDSRTKGKSSKGEQGKVSDEAGRHWKLIRNFTIAFFILGAISVVAMFLYFMSVLDDYNALKSEVAVMESEYEELKDQNDSKEYEINSSVDLDYVVSVATSELGMVRSSSNQVRTYDSYDSEYVQQVAEIPTN